MWNPLEAFRRWVRRQAHDQLAEVLGDSQGSARQELQRLVRSGQLNWLMIGEGQCEPDLDKDVIILDTHFAQPRELVGYIDATYLTNSDTCQIRVLNDMRGKDSLTPLYSTSYAGPIEDYVSLHEQVVVGRVIIIHKQLRGVPRKVWFRFFAR